MERIPKNIALVYDRVNKWGGAEKVLLALHALFPTAPLYTSVYEQAGAPWARVFPHVVTSFLQKVPFASRHHEFFPYLTPIAFETFNFSQYEAVISVTSSDAKGIVTPPGTFHLCYCLTPTRYLWSHEEEYKRQLSPILELVSRPSFKYLKYWDTLASHRPDAYISISKTVRDRVKKFYGIESPVVYPPVETTRFKTGTRTDGGYFLYVSRLVPYKRADVVVSAFTKLNFPLIVAGKGNVSWGGNSYVSNLKKSAGPNIKFVGEVSEQELTSLYLNCKAVVFFNEEDFGIVPVEAQAAGKPIIGLRRGGLLETVVNGETGILAPEDTIDSLISTVHVFNKLEFDADIIAKHSEKFSIERFNREFVKVLATRWQIYRSTYMS
jgi:glycosyltransferase involved in cell wall biosynthesis